MLPIFETEIENRSLEQFAKDPGLAALQNEVLAAAEVLQEARRQLYDRQMEIITGVKKELGLEKDGLSKFECLISEGFYGIG